MSGHPWTYEGSLDKAANALTLEAEGPCPAAPGKLFRFKEVLEVKNKDHKVFTSYVQGENGEWTTVMRINYWRKQ